MEIVKKVKPFCPQCGKRRGLTLRKSEYPVGVIKQVICDGKITNELKNCEMRAEYYICCKNCQKRWQITDLGVWNE